jgi:hypothetical protein
MLDDFRRESPDPMVYLPWVSLSPAYVVTSARADQLAPEARTLINEVVPESPMFRFVQQLEVDRAVNRELPQTDRNMQRPVPFTSLRQRISNACRASIAGFTHSRAFAGTASRARARSSSVHKINSSYPMAARTRRQSAFAVKGF